MESRKQKNIVYFEILSTNWFLRHAIVAFLETLLGQKGLGGFPSQNLVKMGENLFFLSAQWYLYIKMKKLEPRTIIHVYGVI